MFSWVRVGVVLSTIYAIPIIVQIGHRAHDRVNPRASVTSNHNPATTTLERLWSILNPRRNWKLWWAILDQLIMMLKVATQYRRWLLDYQNHPTHLKGTNFGSDYGSELDLYPCSNSKSPTPIVVFIYGGAWQSGTRTMYGSLGKNLAAMGYLVVIPDYVKYPNGDITDITSDVLQCMCWLRQGNAAQYKGDASQIILVGHSAGAHICANILCSLYTRSYDVHDTSQAATASTSTLPPKSDSHGQVRRKRSTDFRGKVNSMVGAPMAADQLLKSVKAFVGLSGVFDIDHHFVHESNRGVEVMSAMERAMLGSDNFSRHSPTKVFDYLFKQNDFKPLVPNLPRTYLYHGEDDGTVPTFASEQFAHVLTSCSADSSNVELIKCPGVDHVGMLTALITPSQTPNTHGYQFHKLFSQLPNIL